MKDLYQLRERAKGASRGSSRGGGKRVNNGDKMPPRPAPHFYESGRKSAIARRHDPQRLNSAQVINRYEVNGERENGCGDLNKGHVCPRLWFDDMLAISRHRGLENLDSPGLHGRRPGCHAVDDKLAERNGLIFPKNGGPDLCWVTG